MTRVKCPGPGLYRCEAAMGKQRASTTKTLPSWKFATSSRWSHHASTFLDQYDTPSSIAYMIPQNVVTGRKIDQASKRWDVCAGIPGQKPTHIAAPGPGTYGSAESGFGNQLRASKTSMPRVAVGKAKSVSHDKMYTSGKHQRILLGTATATAAMSSQQTSIGRQVNSRKISCPMMRFGTGDRFSEIKSKS